MRAVSRSRYMARGAGRLLAVTAPLLLSFMATAKAHAQTPNGETTAPLPKFAVAAIHPIEPGQGPRIIHVAFTPDGLFDEGVPLIVLVRVAFGVPEDRILGGPNWMRTDKYYIQAKVDAADVPRFAKLTKKERWAMVVALFEDRFGLEFHHETKDMQAYTLVIAKGGPKLKESSPGEPGSDGKVPPMKVSGSTEGLHVEAHGASMANLAGLVSNGLHITVIDGTGLTGKYDFTLDYSDEGFGRTRMTQGSEPTTAAMWPSIFTAVQEQLGLKLEAHKEPTDVIVIDHIEKPSPN